MSVLRKIAVFTGTRAEYGLLKPLMDEIRDDPALHLQLIVSGMHLSPEFDLTYRDILADGFTIDEKVEILLSSDTPIGISKSIGLGVISYAEALERLQPDIAVVLGDRFEALAFAIAAYIQRIPIAHIQGGEATYGLIDEGIRHAITKLSYLHFPATETYRQIIIQLGEEPHRVFTVGALGLDNIRKMKLLSREQLEKRLHFTFGKRNFLITFHPVTLEKHQTESYFRALLDALEVFPDIKLLFTKANADTEGRVINQMIDQFVAAHPERAIAFASLGQLLYLSTMQYVDAVVGNSSSGIIEAPSFKIGTINIGSRQAGRIRAKSVIDCEPTKAAIVEAIHYLYSPEFQKILQEVENPYGDGRAAERIVQVLKEVEIPSVIKPFYRIREMLRVE